MIKYPTTSINQVSLELKPCSRVGSAVREKTHFRDRGVPLSIPKEIAGSLFFTAILGQKKIHLYPGLEPHEQGVLGMEMHPPKSTNGQIASHWSPVQELWKVRTIITLWQLTKSRHGGFKVCIHLKWYTQA